MGLGVTLGAVSLRKLHNLGGAFPRTRVRDLLGWGLECLHCSSLPLLLLALFEG